MWLNVCVVDVEKIMAQNAQQGLARDRRIRGAKNK
jgi:hypothetical protein